MTIRIRVPPAVPVAALLALAVLLASAYGPVRDPRQEGAGRTYYVATDGDDSFDGLAPSPAQGSRGPFRTLSRAARAVGPGDTVRIRGGVYEGGSTWPVNGTRTAPITITNYEDEKAVIDGDRFRLPGREHDLLLQVYGDWYRVSDLEVRYSSGYGVAVHGLHGTIDNVFAHHNWNSGIFITGWHGLIVNCRAAHNSLLNERFRPHQGTWGFGISACRHPQYTTIRGCTAWGNWGEGISTFESQHITIEDCVSYDNQQNFYISDTKFCLFRRNLSYCTPGNPIQAYVTQNGILIGDEKRNPPSSDNVFVNNLVMGGERNLAAGGGQLVNGLVANNTFVNASVTGGPDSACVYFYKGSAKGARFVNNIVCQEDRATLVHLEARGIAFARNNWSRRAPAGCRGRGDVIGNPKLLRIGPTGPGSLTPEWFRISVISPARDRAEPLDETSEDMAGKPRGERPDIGALEARSGRFGRRAPGP